MQLSKDYFKIEIKYLFHVKFAKCFIERYIYVILTIAIQCSLLHLRVYVGFVRVNQIGKMRRGFMYVSLEGHRSHRMRNTEKRKRVWMQFAAVDRDDRAERR